MMYQFKPKNIISDLEYVRDCIETELETSVNKELSAIHERLVNLINSINNYKIKIISLDEEIMNVINKYIGIN